MLDLVLDFLEIILEIISHHSSSNTSRHRRRRRRCSPSRPPRLSSVSTSDRESSQSDREKTDMAGPRNATKAATGSARRNASTSQDCVPGGITLSRGNRSSYRPRTQTSYIQENLLVVEPPPPAPSPPPVPLPFQPRTRKFFVRSKISPGPIWIRTCTTIPPPNDTARNASSTPARPPPRAVPDADCSNSARIGAKQVKETEEITIDTQVKQETRETIVPGEIDRRISESSQIRIREDGSGYEYRRPDAENVQARQRKVRQEEDDILIVERYTMPSGERVNLIPARLPPLETRGRGHLRSRSWSRNRPPPRSPEPDLISIQPVPPNSPTIPPSEVFRSRRPTAPLRRSVTSPGPSRAAPAPELRPRCPSPAPRHHASRPAHSRSRSRGRPSNRADPNLHLHLGVDVDVSARLAEIGERLEILRRLQRNLSRSSSRPGNAPCGDAPKEEHSRPRVITIKPPSHLLGKRHLHSASSSSSSSSSSDSSTTSSFPSSSVPHLTRQDRTKRLRLYSKAGIKERMFKAVDWKLGWEVKADAGLGGKGKGKKGCR